MNKKAFTLIELLVVVLIIGILAAVALPQYQKAVIKTRFNSMLPILRSLAEAKKIYYLANGEHARTFDVLDVRPPADCLAPTSNGWYGEMVVCGHNEFAIMLDSSQDHSISVQFHPKNLSSCHVLVYFPSSSTISKVNYCYSYGSNSCDYLCRGLSTEEPVSDNGAGYRKWTF